MDDIILDGGRWKIGASLASGGFGQVYEATNEEGVSAVAKFVPKAPGAARELLFEELSSLPNIVPILDSGETEAHYVLVMPRAAKSLRQHLDDSSGALPLDEAVSILADVAQALASLGSNVVHRDLKPENVLFLQGRWCIADFGIARYAEQTTAPDTRKYAMTSAYAAPEQWRFERATTATDVYAFGVMAYEILRGARPFEGPDFREQHLNQTPPPLTDCPPSIAGLVTECLYKPGPARPSAANIVERLRASQTPASPAAQRLQAANRSVVESRAEQAAEVSAAQSREVTRKELEEAARQSFVRLQEAVSARVLEAAPATGVSGARDGGLVMTLGEANLIFDPVKGAPANCLATPGYEAPFDVVVYSGITVRKPRDRYGYEGRAHGLWFCDAQEEGSYRWYELAFMVSPSIPERSTLDPFLLPPTDDMAAVALTPVIDVRQVAWQPRPIDQGEEEQFIERWLDWFASASDGSLGHPSVVPEPEGRNGGFQAPPPKPPRLKFPW